jgi:XTP/dITP diphosphohydrolase
MDNIGCDYALFMPKFQGVQLFNLLYNSIHVRLIKNQQNMKIILSTRNPSKAEQIKAIFDHPDIEVLTLTEAGIEGEAVEDGTTLEENALKKATYARENTNEKVWAMADDTGLFITALNGFPGIHAARCAGINATTEETMQFILDKMKGIDDRSAFFETVVVLLSPDGEKYCFNGKVNGWLAKAPKTKPQPKMPYSPLFSPDGSDKVWAEMTIEEENAISHRGKAFRQVVEFLK